MYKYIMYIRIVVYKHMYIYIYIDIYTNMYVHIANVYLC